MANSVVGARELKVRLGTYLRQVRQGRTLVVTDRGQPVAELRPLSAATGDAAVLAGLEARGIVRRPTRNGLAPFRPIVARGEPLSTAVIEDREDRV
jgi:prevent-host-death family protein